MQKMEYIKKCSRDIAQLGLARLSGGQKVESSNLSIPTIFLPLQGIKLCSNSLIYLPKFANPNFLEDKAPDATLKNVTLRL